VNTLLALLACVKAPTPSLPGVSAAAGAPQTATDGTPLVATAEPLADSDIAAIAARLDAASSSGDKVQALLLGTQGRAITAVQAATLLRRFSFSSDQLVALGHLAPWIRDRQDAQTILDVFTFSADKARARELLR